MKINQLRLQNFLSFGEREEVLNFSNHTTIVGPNDAGKTNIFRTVSFIGDLLRRQFPDTDQYYHDRNIEKPFKVELNIEFSKEESEMFLNFLICSAMQENIQHQQGEDGDRIFQLNFEAIKQNGKKFFEGFANKLSIIAVGEGQEAYAVIPIIIIKKNGKKLFMHQYGDITLGITRPRSGASTGFAGFIFDELRRKKKGKVTNFLTKKSQDLPSTQMKLPNAFDFCMNYLTSHDSSWVSMQPVQFDLFERRPIKTPDEAKRLRTFLRKHGYTENGISFEKLLTIIFDNAIVKTSNLRSIPQSSLSDRVEQSLGSRFLEFTGKDLPLVLFELKNSTDQKMRRMYHQIHETFADIFDGVEFDVAIDTRVEEKSSREITTIPKNSVHPESMNEEQINLLVTQPTKEKILHHDLILQITKGKISTSIDFAAAGMFDTLFVLTCLVGHKNKTILLDEPALNLHPNLQRKIIETIQQTISKNENQVILITHSPYLISLANFENTWRIVFSNNSSEIINLASSVSQVDKSLRQKMMIQLQKSDIRSMLFSRGVVFVEGPSDKIVFEKLDRKLTEKHKGPQLDENEWAIIDIGGKDFLYIFLNLAKWLKVPYLAIMDNDALMQCNHSIKPDGKKIVTSAIMYSIFNSNSLSKDKIKTLEKYQKRIQQGKYLTSFKNQLDRMARKEGIYVLKNSLEGSFKVKLTAKESKPIKAFNEIVTKIMQNKIPKEPYEVMNFIKRRT